MKNLTKIALLASLSFSALATDIVPGKKQVNPVLLKGGTLHTVTDGVKANHDLLIENGIISQIGENLSAPANSQVVDVSGKQIYPGLIGLSTNVGLVEIGAVRATRDNVETGRATPEVKAHVAYNADSEIIPTLRSHGVTHVQAMDRAYATPAMFEASGIRYSLAIEGNWPVRNLAFAAGQSIAYGVTAETALRSITLEPARVLGVEDRMGSLTVGKQANIVVSDGDIFDHITHKVEMLLIDGRQVNVDNRHKRLYRKYSDKPEL